MRGAPGPVRSGAGTDQAARRCVRAAWASVAGLPVSFAAAMVLGDRLLTLQGYESGASPVPPEVALRAGGPALLVLVMPAVAAVWFGLRARRLGAERGLPPAVIGAVVAVGSVLQNALAYVVGFLRG